MTLRIRRAVCAAVVSCSVLVVAGPAVADNLSPLATLRKMTDLSNKGDMKGASALYASDIAVVDEFAPYEWHGPTAMASYLDAFTAWAKARGRTDGVVKISSVLRNDVDGDSAYVVVREVYTYKDHGKKMSETGDMACTLHNSGADGWKITAVAWAGTHPAAVVAKPMAAAPAAAAPAKKP